jgi:hypothetical protein
MYIKCSEHVSVVYTCIMLSISSSYARYSNRRAVLATQVAGTSMGYVSLYMVYAYY